MLTLLVPTDKIAVPLLSRYVYDTNSARKHNYAHKTLQQFIQTDKSNNKAHTLTIRIAN